MFVIEQGHSAIFNILTPFGYKIKYRAYFSYKHDQNIQLKFLNGTHIRADFHDNLSEYECHLLIVKFYSLLSDPSSCRIRVNQTQILFKKWAMETFFTTSS